MIVITVVVVVITAIADAVTGLCVLRSVLLFKEKYCACENYKYVTVIKKNMNRIQGKSDSLSSQNKKIEKRK